MDLKGLKQKWQSNNEGYKQHEIGGGVHDFVSEMFSSSDLFRLTKVATVDKKTQVFTHDTVQKDKGRPDFVLHINKDVTIPVEVKCFGKIEEGVSQILRYQLDYNKQYGILTDGNEWRFYRAGQYNRYFLQDFFEKTNEFLIFWNHYIKPEHYYIEIFNREEKENLFEEKIDLNDTENRKIFFEDTTKLISDFRVKLKIADTSKMTEKQEVETVYSYLIQFVLFKVIVDNGFKNFTEWYKNLYKLISKYLLDTQNYQSILNHIKMIADYVSSNIYKPFALEQENINKKLFNNLKTDLTIDDISAWLDIIIFIDKYNFGNLKNEIFGFIYENYLKDLYDDKNKGQYFTDPEVVNLMLEEIGYTPEELGKDKYKISIIDPACGAGTFLYSAVDAILRCFSEQLTENEALKVQQLIIKNIFGLDIEEFPLYLAEMNILMRLLPMIISDNYENPINDKIKIFKTKDSISEFLDAGIGAINPEIDYPSLFSNTSLGYKSFMRDDKNLQEMIESMQGHNGERMRFDFVVGNPPYIGYNESCRQEMPFTLQIKDKNYHSITMSDVYGVNLNTVPNLIKPYSPKPNLYAFFIALGIALLKEKGKMSFIIPQTMLTAGDLDVLRYHLAKNTVIEKLITFEGNLFVGRGLEQKRPIATSSLIFVLKKEKPNSKHTVEIINYDPYIAEQGEIFRVYFHGKYRNKPIYILQSDLLKKIKNWNFIKLNKKSILFHKQYDINSLSIEDYRRKILSNYDEITIDGGLDLIKDKFSKQISDDCYKVFNPKINDYKKFLVTKTNLFYDKQGKIGFLPGSQGMKAFINQYKIIWKTRFNDIFQFSDEKNLLLNGNQSLLISSNNKSELLFLFSLLNTTISKKVLQDKLKLPNEQSYIVPLTAIKQYIRIPKITSENQKIKDKIIVQTEKMLDIENVTLKDLVEFKDLMIQRFDNIEIKDNNLIMTFNKIDYSCKIKKGKEDFVKKVILDKYFDNSLIFNRNFVTLQELKNTEAIDFEKQKEIKNYIDDLVFALYFGVELPNINFENAQVIEQLCNKNEFYNRN